MLAIEGNPPESASWDMRPKSEPARPLETAHALAMSLKTGLNQQAAGLRRSSPVGVGCLGSAEFAGVY